MYRFKIVSRANKKVVGEFNISDLSIKSFRKLPEQYQTEEYILIPTKQGEQRNVFSGETKD